ncbi:hypothetical protein [Nitrosomonas sp. Nm34]|uniref:hypothetical protein n=1 Tax=Nitrosomonas sp. Nm34 TaxID=1881055 RepID=UPI0008E02FF1|nr:hypothetical protein [Nitrosomonas sp. Nm34]SFI74908.1 hypothetical protein SAMN05428978_103222 [Nitrosomonas sp. Nm34]
MATNLAELKSNPLPSTEIKVGFMNAASFELIQRAARMISNSTLVPAPYQAVHKKLDKYGNVTEAIENPNAISNCVIAINMASRMNADPLMIAQNLYVIEGRPSWSSQWIIAAINSCGRFSPLRFDIKELGKKTLQYTTYSWENNKKVPKLQQVEINDKECIAWVIEKETGERLESPPVTIEMAVKEGWYTKNGSKWQTMDSLMLRYRTASFFGKLYAPELLMGLQTAEEIHDMVIDAAPDGKGGYSVDIDSLKPVNDPKEGDPVSYDPKPEPKQEAKPETKRQSKSAETKTEPVKPANPPADHTGESYQAGSQQFTDEELREHAPSESGGTYQSEQSEQDPRASIPAAKPRLNLS